LGERLGFELRQEKNIIKSEVKNGEVKTIKSLEEIEHFIDTMPKANPISRKSIKKARSLTRKTFSILVVVIVAISIVGMGALVNYISNQTRATVGVDSPISICTIDDDDVGGTMPWTIDGAVPGGNQDWLCGEPAGIDLGEIYGGGSVSYWIRVTNNANEVIESNLSFYVNCDEGLAKTGSLPDLEILDFKKVSVTVYDWVPDSPPTTKRMVVIDDVFDTSTYPGGYQMDGSGHLLIWFESYLFPAGGNGAEYFVKIDMTFANGAHGHYDIATQMLEDPTDWS